VAPLVARRKHDAAFVFGLLIVLLAGVLALWIRGSIDGRSSTETISRSTTPTTAAPTTTAAPPIDRYEVRRGDTLSSIADRFGVTIDALVLANRIDDRDHLTEGRVLVIPPRPPVELAVTPATATPGDDVQLSLSGAKPSEPVVFEIHSPSGTYTGPRHVADADGRVTTTYRPSAGALPGTYTVVARGDRGTTAEADFEVEALGAR
jgi:LysM repeat protein